MLDMSLEVKLLENGLGGGWVGGFLVKNRATPWSNLQVRTCKIQAKLDSKLDPSVAIEEIIPFPVFKTSFGVVVKTLKHFVKEVF